MASVDSVVGFLIDKFQAPDYRPVFRKICWQLDRGTIERLVGAAFELGGNPRGYFIACAKNEIKKRTAPGKNGPPSFAA